MSQKIKFSSSDFQQVLRCLAILKDICNDVDIHDGIVRQRLNDHSCIFEMHLNPILKNVSIPITTLKQTLELIKCFSKQDEIFLKIDNETYSIYDKFTSLTFQMPFSNYIDNKFIPEDEIKNIFNLDDNYLLLSCELNKIITDRMKSVINGFSINSIQVNFIDDTYNIVAKSHSTDKEAKFFTGKLLCNKKFDSTSFTRFMYVPFIVDHDDNLKLSIFEEDEICIAKIESKIDNVDLRILTRSTLRLLEDQD